MTPIRALAALFVLAPGVAHAEAACLEQHAKAQELRNQGQLVAARVALTECAQSSCPKLVAADCTRWLEEVSDTIPSIVVRVMNGDREVDDARVFIDGEAAKLDGRPIELDPGTHQIRVELSGSPSVEREVVAKTGVRARIVEIELASPKNAAHDSKAEPAPSAGAHPVVWIAGGIGVLGLASFSYFGLRAKNRYDELDDSCAPSCNASDSDEVKRDFLIADISLAVAALGFGTATYFLLSPPRSGNRVGISAFPTRSGAWLGVSANY